MLVGSIVEKLTMNIMIVQRSNKSCYYPTKMGSKLRFEEKDKYSSESNANTKVRLFSF